LDYCNSRGISILTFIEDTVSGKSSWRERAIGNILEKAEKGDVIVASEISRLGRSTLQVLEIMEMAAQKGITVHIAKNNMVLDGSMQSTITATVLGLAAQTV
jgi:DNA invertase Pin-like site-specific DNA recombinase